MMLYHHDNGGIAMIVNRIVEDIAWVSHKLSPEAKTKTLISKKDDGLDVSCVLVDLPVGVEIPEHIHDQQDDILYPLKGKATMWVDGTGFFTLEPGVIVRVPKGTKHKIIDVVEDMIIYDVFSPATV